MIWNPDGSTAELSGNGTRIAARWLADRTGAEEVRIRVGPRETVARVKNGDVEQELGAVTVAEPEQIAGLDVIVVDVGNPHAVVIGDPDDLPRIGPLLETHPRFPRRTNVQVARVDGPGRGHGTRLGARRGGDAVVGNERRRRRRGDPRRRRRARPLSRRRPPRRASHGGRATLTGPAERL